MAVPVAQVIYNSKRLIPAPNLAFSRQSIRSEDGTLVGFNHTVTLTGKLVACKGWDFTGPSPALYTLGDYPADDTSCCKFANLLEMQDAINALFQRGEDYKWFEVASDAGPYRKWLARVTNVEFKEGRWIEVVDYTITLELQNPEEEDNHIAHSEKWEVQFKEDEGAIYELTHTISCNSKDFYDTGAADLKEGWELAKEWVDARLGVVDPDLIYDSTGFNINPEHPHGTPYDSYNYKVQKSADETSGQYSVTETWTLSKYKVIATINVEASFPRVGDATVKVSGNFKGLLNDINELLSRIPNPTDARTVFSLWEGENADGAYQEALSVYGSSRPYTLNPCPAARSVTYHNKIGYKPVSEPPNTPEDIIDGESYRIVEFSYEFSESPTQLYDAEVTYSDKTTKNKECETIISVSGNIQGFVCYNSSVTAIENAQAAFNDNYLESTLKTNALAFYNLYHDPDIVVITPPAVGTALFLVSSSITKNERKGTISFAYEYSNKVDSSGIRRNKSESIAEECNVRDSNGEAVITHTVEGSLEGSCDTLWATLLSEADDEIPTLGEGCTIPYPTGSSTNGIITRVSTSRDEINHRITYSYVCSSYTGTARAEITVTTKNGPSSCLVTYRTVQVEIQGVGCSDTEILNSANAALTNLTPSPDSIAADGYAGMHRLSSVVSVGTTSGKISATYEYSNETTFNAFAEMNLSVTESYDGADCGNKKVSVKGQIKGHCGNPTGALDAAGTAFSSFDITDYCTGRVISKSKTTDEKNATIDFSYECDTRSYIHDQTVTVKDSREQNCKIVTVEGTVTPICDWSAGNMGQVSDGENAFNNDVLPYIQGLAESASGITSANIELKSSVIGKNKINGRITYNYEYTCKECCRYFTGSLKESYSIVCNKPTPVVAIVPILGRTLGPLIQPKNTQTAAVHTVTINAQFPAPSCPAGGDTSWLSPPSGIDVAVSGLIVLLQANSSCCLQGSTTYVQEDTENWNPCTGNYGRTVKVICEACP